MTTKPRHTPDLSYHCEAGAHGDCVDCGWCTPHCECDCHSAAEGGDVMNDDRSRALAAYIFVSSLLSVVLVALWVGSR